MILTLTLQSSHMVNIFETSHNESWPKYAWILCTWHDLLLVRSKVKVKVKQKVKFTSLAITSHLIVTETSNLVHILVYENPHQI